ncbi:MAG: Ribonuclease HI [Candidatus Ozemobacter sibiricus]|jgi:ribonuclease HI|uniref:Ribonuclease H n=1 Tax=Candidatus Ozemobacter sibiricus TaxID=2268124 RepID=A0A367ZTM8_9BACT|nr:MAG: Ribonuclease HI [Candidatus Ozemobacter sibiricus]
MSGRPIDPTGSEKKGSSGRTTEPRKVVEIFCDGACQGNPGPGGWGAILRYQGTEKEISGGEPDTTNNRMELTACLEAIRCLKEPCRVVIQTDSQYLAKAFNDGWLEKWQQNGWRAAGGHPVKNRDLWEELLRLTARHQITWRWIRGHAGHPENERCDRLAVAARDHAARATRPGGGRPGQTSKA